MTRHTGRMGRVALLTTAVLLVTLSPGTSLHAQQSAAARTLLAQVDGLRKEKKEAEALETADRATTLAAEMGDRVTEADAARMAGRILYSMGRYADSKQRYTRAQAAAVAMNDRVREAQLLHGLANADWGLGRRADARRQYRAGDRLVSRPAHDARDAARDARPRAGDRRRGRKPEGPEHGARGGGRLERQRCGSVAAAGPGGHCLQPGALRRRVRGASKGAPARRDFRGSRTAGARLDQPWPALPRPRRVGSGDRALSVGARDPAIDWRQLRSGAVAERDWIDPGAASPSRRIARLLRSGDAGRHALAVAGHRPLSAGCARDRADRAGAAGAGATPVAVGAGWRGVFIQPVLAPPCDCRGLHVHGRC